MTRRRVVATVTLAGLTALAGWGLWPAAVDNGIVYSTPGGEPLTLDLDFPTGPGPHPVVVFGPHRGDWSPSFKRENRCRQLLAALTGRGYAVATVHYRLIGAHQFPAQVFDGKAAIRWVRTNGSRYGLATERIGAVGFSAGGYGACMVGTTGPGDGFDEPGEDPAASRVQAVAVLGAPADLTTPTWSAVVDRMYLRPFLGKAFAEDPGLYARASPATYATPDDPPFLLVHSVGDLLIPVSQPRALAAKLRQVGVPVELVEEDGIMHIWGGERLDRTLDRVVTFLDRHLRPATGK